ncbi:MAG: hypothetical protein KTR20_13195 [Cellvibrionaceae bacterium]|nr:hypothetical protein [Cellvibrionaceae bacterium]
MQAIRTYAVRGAASRVQAPAIDKVVVGLMLLLINSPVSAHVKWFAPYDVMAPPKSITQVLTPNFLQWIVVSFVLVFIVVLVDKRWTGMNHHIANARQSLYKKLPHHFEFNALRYALIIFFVAVWTLGDVILTPELKHNSVWVSAVHLCIIGALLSARTAKYAGVGIFLLWGYSAYKYGFFHLSDYMIFLGLAMFLIIYSLRPDSANSLWRYLILYAAISATLQWASIEKFVYPEWTYPILEDKSHLTMGFAREKFMNMAGFVEFVFAFLLIATSGISFIVATLGLATMFISAIIDFGKVDAIGHLGIIAALFVMAIHGPSKLNLWMSNLHQNVVLNAFYLSLIYSVSLTLFFVFYYLVRYLWLLTLAH